MATGVFGSEVILQNNLYRYLVDHAIQHAWCNPEMDNQHIVAPIRITPFTGVLNRVEVMLRTITLPTQSEIYHVFQIGQLHPLVIGLLQKNPTWSQEQWISVSDAMNNQKLMADIYTDLGIQIPRFEVFYMFSNDRDLIIAVKQNKKIPIDYQRDQIYLRVYSNSFFRNLLGDTSEEYIYCHGEKVVGVTQLLALQNQFTTYAGKKGLVSAFVNGSYVDAINLFNVKVGDFVEYVYDSSFYKTVVFSIGQLNNFVSELDSKQKYLLHYAGTDSGTIDYHDDMDIYLVNPGTNGSYNGVYYHRNTVDSCRMVTHRDYSLPVTNLVALSEGIKKIASLDVLDVQSLQIKVNFRKSAYQRPLVYEANRIQELYKMSETDILDAMIGTNATVPEWRVESLEKSGYTQVMHSESKDVNISLVQDAYGYNACSMILGDTPRKTFDYSGRKRVDVPRSLTLNSTAYEYDENGLLLGFYSHTTGVEYLATNSNCALVEMISGIATHQPDVRLGTDSITVPSADNYRVYRCRQTASGIDNNWEDVTGSDKYTVSNNVITWSEADYNPYVMVRTDANFLGYSQDITFNEGILHFLLTEVEIRLVNNVATDINVNLPIPLGELDIFLNGYSLIENVDYIVNFPEVIIVSKRFLNLPVDTAVQKLVVRYTGFCQSNMTREVSSDQGWVQYGVLSKNKKFDIRDDKVLRIIMNGSLYHRDALKFSETSQDLGIVNGLNGFPYLIRDIVVPMKNETTKETYAFRKLAEETDTRISNYLSLKIPEITEANPSAITERYALFSPFFSRIIHALESGIINPTSALSDNQILTICKPYETWLKVDPLSDSTNFDHDYVTVHPCADYSAVSLKFFAYQFVKRVEKLYGNGVVDLSSFIMLAPAS